MTNQQHPITPPPELVEQWRTAPEYANGKQMFEMVSISTSRLQQIATQAARWGADQELEACCEWTAIVGGAEALRAARRPKPPSLKAQALAALAAADGADHPVVATVITADQHDIIRRALEALPE